MRLAQLARKVKVKPAEIRNFIKDEFNVELDNDPNVKIEEDHVTAVMDKFQIIDEPAPEKLKKKPAEAEKVEDVKEEIEPNKEVDIEVESSTDNKESLEETKEELKESEDAVPAAAHDASEAHEKVEPSKAKKVVKIKHEEGEEAAKQPKEEESENFEPVEVDPDADLISAEVERLEGLKVVGKIDLGQDKETEKLMNEEVELPSSEEVESEIDELDGDVDTSDFPEIAEQEDNEEKEAIFAELDAQMESGQQSKVKKAPAAKAEAVKDNMEDEDEEEFSIYKNKRGEYRFTLEQKKNREKSLFEKKQRERIEREKEKKKRHYEENIAPKVKKKNKAKKKKKKKVEAKRKTEQKVQGKKQEPKGLWQRFLNWLND